MAVIFRADKGSKLTPAEVDENFLSSRNAPGNSPAAMKPAAGLWVGNAIASVTANTYRNEDVMTIAPFKVAFDMERDRAGFNIFSISGPNLYGRIVVFDTNDSGVPTTQLGYSNLILTNSTGLKQGDFSFTFQKNKMYFLGLWAEAYIGITTLRNDACNVLTWTTALVPSQTLSKVVAGSNGVLADWAYTGSDHSTLITPLILLRAA